MCIVFVIFSIWLVLNTNRFLVGICMYLYWLVLVVCSIARSDYESVRLIVWCWGEHYHGTVGSQWEAAMTHQSGGGEDLGGRHAIQTKTIIQHNCISFYNPNLTPHIFNLNCGTRDQSRLRSSKNIEKTRGWHSTVDHSHDYADVESWLLVQLARLS